jgi:uncharacterized protein involved in propanediol utilization
VSVSPYTFDEARTAAANASRAQKMAEDFIRQAYHDFALKEEAYRVALALRITELHAEGVAWSSTADLARGDKAVARLRRERDIAEGVKEAASQAGWRASKDRDDTAALISWSARRELAEVGVGG